MRKKNTDIGERSFKLKKAIIIGVVVFFVILLIIAALAMFSPFLKGRFGEMILLFLILPLMIMVIVAIPIYYKKLEAFKISSLEENSDIIYKKMGANFRYYPNSDVKLNLLLKDPSMGMEKSRTGSTSHMLTGILNKRNYKIFNAEFSSQGLSRNDSSIYSNPFSGMYIMEDNKRFKDTIVYIRTKEMLRDLGVKDHRLLNFEGKEL